MPAAVSVRCAFGPQLPVSTARTPRSATSRAVSIPAPPLCSLPVLPTTSKVNWSVSTIRMAGHRPNRGSTSASSESPEHVTATLVTSWGPRCERAHSGPTRVLQQCLPGAAPARSDWSPPHPLPSSAPIQDAGAGHLRHSQHLDRDHDPSPDLLLSPAAQRPEQWAHIPRDPDRFPVLALPGPFHFCLAFEKSPLLRGRAFRSGQSLSCRTRQPSTSDRKLELANATTEPLELWLEGSCATLQRPCQPPSDGDFSQIHGVSPHREGLRPHARVAPLRP